MTEEIQGNGQSGSTQTIYIGQVNKTNGMGVAGFVFALLGLFLGWIPVFGWIIWVLGVVFSIVGVFKKPNGLAIAGLVISFIGIIILVGFAGLIGAALLVS
jgi:hypothetical protein